MTTIRVTETREVQVTPENEIEIIKAEYEARYGDNEFIIGDIVRFTRDGKATQLDLMGGSYAGKRGIVSHLGDGNSIKVLCISNHNEFKELWVKGYDVELIED